MGSPPRVFLSYARKDGEAFATALRRRLAADEPEITLWQDRAELEGGTAWWPQIEAALDQVKFPIIVVTPRALESAIVRREWHYARRRGVIVYPVKGFQPMFVLPYRKFSIDTDLSPSQVLSGIQEATEPERGGWAAQWTRSLSPQPHLPFEGRLTGNSFDIARIIHYRNSFRPRIWGTVDARGSGSRVTATMGPHPLAAVLLVAILSVSGRLAVATIPDALASGVLESASWAPLIIFAVAAVIAVGGFVYEASRTFRELAAAVSASRSGLG